MPIRRRRRDAPPDVADLVRQVGAVLDELRLTEAEVTFGDVRVRVQRAAAPVIAPPAAGAAAGAAPLGDQVVIVERPGNMVTLEAPMVGTFYRASGPAADPYVREGDVVKEGQIVCIIEAMKLMNEIEAKTAGRVAKVLVENGQAVEYGQPLFLIEPAR
ncbi:MAG TPA: acetyl-CoA carboxylase biotin carboxyl carrier protein [Terriglobales bacterium]|nr:acetyl-CoA carboxylase biotin carboxyl carrier protein [Terriglobales bacterium]